VTRDQNEKTRDLVSVGETIAMFVARDVGVPNSSSACALRVGGAESVNTVGSTELAGSACWIGRVGDDSPGEEVRTLQGQGVGVRAQRDPGRPTGLMLEIRLTPLQQRVSCHRAGSAGSALCTDDIDPSGIIPARSSTAAHAVSDAAVAGGGCTLLPLVDVVFAGVEDPAPLGVAAGDPGEAASALSEGHGEGVPRREDLSLLDRLDPVQP
jgi:2-dehydro-3-deoxygluconokinase